jgi:hypothetical protein
MEVIVDPLAKFLFQVRLVVPYVISIVQRVGQK